MNKKLLPIAQNCLIGFKPSNIPYLALSLALVPSASALAEKVEPSSPSVAILAQLPNPITPTLPSEPIPNPSPTTVPDVEISPPPPPPPESREGQPEEKITVTKFEFSGNTAVSSQTLAEATSKYLNRPISFVELVEVETLITKLYTDAGYINSGAFIPAGQTLTARGAVIKVNIVEGGIEDIKVSGTQRLSQEYISSRIKPATSVPLSRDKLIQALQVLQLNPLIESISAQLSTGSRPELGILELDVKEADAFDLGFFADNGRAPSVGSFRRGVRLVHRNFTGLGDTFSAAYTNTDGSNAGDISYTVPVNARNGTIAFRGGFTDTSVIEPPFDRIDITGDSNYLELSYRQPVVETPRNELALGFTLSRQQSQTQLLGFDFPLSPGANAKGETRITALRFFQDYTNRNPNDVLALRSEFSVGLGLFDATLNDEPPDSSFLSWRGQAQYVRRLAPDTLFVFRSNLQFANRVLVPLEQFGVGGLQSVRGYRQDLLLTDNGLFASAEFKLPLIKFRRSDGVLSLVPFLDFGTAWNSSGNDNPDPNTLVGTGLGLEWKMGDNFNARLDYGIPLVDVNSSDRTLQEQGLYFSVFYNLF